MLFPTRFQSCCNNLIKEVKIIFLFFSQRVKLCIYLWFITQIYLLILLYSLWKETVNYDTKQTEPKIVPQHFYQHKVSTFLHLGVEEIQCDYGFVTVDLEACFYCIINSFGVTKTTKQRIRISALRNWNPWNAVYRATLTSGSRLQTYCQERAQDWLVDRYKTRKF